MNPDLSRSRAILIGNATYQNSGIPGLSAANTCVDAMTEMLAGDLCGWPTERITRLVELNTPDELARQVVAGIRDAEDVLLVYYVGHGLRTGEGQLALTLGQTDPHPELLAYTGMVYENLAKILRGCRASTKLVILDCCHAGLGNKANYVFQSGSIAEVYPVEGLYFIGASAQDKKAKSPLDGPLTYFTDALITVINTGIPGGPPTLQLDQIFREVRARLLRANKPEPVESSTRGARQFPFARNAANLGNHLDPNDKSTADPFSTPAAPVRPKPSRTSTVLSRRRFLAASAGTGVASAVAGGGWLLARDAHSNIPTTGQRSAATSAPATSQAATLLAQPIHCEASVRAVAFSADETLLANGTDDRTVQIWDIRKPARPISWGKTLTGHVNGVTSIAFSPKQPILASSDASGFIRLWKTDDPHEPLAGVINGGNSSTNINQIAFSPRDGTLAFCDYKGNMQFWDISDPGSPRQISTAPAKILNDQSIFINSIAYSRDGRKLASGGGDRSTDLWDVQDVTRPEFLSKSTVTSGLPPSESVWSVAYSPNGKIIASGYLDGAVRLWNAKNPELTNLSLPMATSGNKVRSTAFSSGSTILAAGNDDNSIWLWDVSKPNVPTNLPSLKKHSNAVYSVAFSPKTNILASGSRDATIILWKLGYAL